MNLIRELGTKIDMTLEPGYVDSPWSPHLRGFTDWANIPRSPYMPATDDYSQPARAASSGLFELPLSTVPISIVKKTERILSIAKALSSRKRNQLDKPHGPLLRELRWYLGTKYESLYVATSAFFFRRGVRWILETQENPYFALVVRSDDCIDIDACSRMKGNLRILADEARNVGASLAFTTPDKALRMLGIANDGID